MGRVAAFAEDEAHRQVIGALVRRVAEESAASVELEWRSAVGGHGRVATELGRYLTDLERQGEPRPDLVIVATDANCRGLRQRIADLGHPATSVPLVFAIPDPHVERWLLLDGAAFKEVLGKGCDAPDQKCSRGRYKQLLSDAVRGAGREPLLGGIEYAADIVGHMDLDRATGADASLRRFVEELRRALRGAKGGGRSFEL